MKRPMSVGLRWTLARRVCMTCGVLIGYALWPWSGEPLVTTHGFCEPCFAALEDDL